MSLADYAREHGLKRVGARPALLEYLAEAWKRRDFAFTMARFNSEAANAKNRLGRWWTVLLPTVQALVYGLIFGVLMGSTRPENYIPFLFTGVFLFSFISGAFGAGAGSVTGNLGLVRSLSFPRMLLPVQATIQQVFNLLPQMVLLLLTWIVFAQPITWAWLLLIPITLLMIMFSTGLALVSARLTVHVQDLTKLIPFIIRIVFYTSGIFFNMERVLKDYPVALEIEKYNPVYVFVSLARGVGVSGYETTPFMWFAALGWAVLTLALGIVFFWKAEERYGRED
jgi:teichoic acid transport system permease protein